MIKIRKIKVKSIENEEIIMAMSRTKTVITKIIIIITMRMRLKICNKNWSKGLNFVAVSSNIDNTKLKMQLEYFGRMLRLKWHFRNENKDIHYNMFKAKSKFNPPNKDAVIELYLSSLEEKLMKVEVRKDKFSNLTNSERKALYGLKNNKSIVIKIADKGSAVAVWDRKDYIK